jgi:hypothetical protein
MPELSRFLGIVIRMFAEAGESHQRPHFHAYYQDAAAVFGADEVELIAGALPRRQERLVLAWAEIHQAELLAAWQSLQNGQPPERIEPLQ